MECEQELLDEQELLEEQESKREEHEQESESEQNDKYDDNNESRLSARYPQVISYQRGRGMLGSHGDHECNLFCRRNERLRAD